MFDENAISKIIIIITHGLLIESSITNKTISNVSVRILETDHLSKTHSIYIL